jgi:hypothetical protein
MRILTPDFAWSFHTCWVIGLFPTGRPTQDYLSAKRIRSFWCSARFTRMFSAQWQETNVGDLLSIGRSFANRLWVKSLKHLRNTSPDLILNDVGNNPRTNLPWLGMIIYTYLYHPWRWWWLGDGLWHWVYHGKPHISNASQDMVTLKTGHPKISWLIIMLLIWGWVETNEFTVVGGINIWEKPAILGYLGS